MKLIDLYARMARARAFELGLAELWKLGLVPGEMHLGTGEEAIAAAVTAHLRRGDAIALDHRGTPALVLLGVDMAALVAECMGKPEGLCGGRGGHMHLFSPEHLAASSGIVGAAGPTAAGFALAAKHLRPGAVAVAMFGDGAANQGMLLESFNLAAAWALPVIFVCKDNGWAITTRTRAVTGGKLAERARGFGLPAEDVDGLDAAAVHAAAGRALSRARRGRGPSFLHATCARLDGHLLGDPLLAAAKHPLSEGAEVFRKVMAAAVRSGGGSLGERAAGLLDITKLVVQVRNNQRGHGNDPLVRARRKLGGQQAQLAEIDERAAREVQAAVARARDEGTAS